MVEPSTIVAADEARYAATLAADTDALDRLLHNELIYGHSSSSADDKTSYISAIKSGDLTYHRIDWSNRVILDRGGTALVFCTVAMEVTVNGTLQHMTNRTLAVWERSGSQWKLLASHSTPLK